MVPFCAEGGTHLLEHALDVFRPGLGVCGVANTSTTAPASMPVAPESVIQAADVYWPGRPGSLLDSGALVTVVTGVIVGILDCRAVAAEAASAAAAAVGAGVGVGVLAAGADWDRAGTAWVEQPVRRTAATPIAASCFTRRTDSMVAGGRRPPRLGV